MTFFNSLVFRKAFKLASAAPAVDLMANLPVVVPDDIAELVSTSCQYEMGKKVNLKA